MKAILLHLAAIRGPLDDAAGGTRRREHPFELHARKHVGIAPVAELAAQRRLELLEAGRENHAAHVDLAFHGQLIVANGAGRTGLHALHALAAQAARQAAPGFGDGLLRGVALVDLGEGAQARGQVHVRHGDAVFPRRARLGIGGRLGLRGGRRRLRQLAAAKVGIDGLGGSVALAHGIGDGSRTQHGVSAREDAGDAGGQRALVGGDPAARARGHAQAGRIDGLADGHDDGVRGQHGGLRFVEARLGLPGLAGPGDARVESDAGDLAAGGLDPGGSQIGVEDHAFLEGFGQLPRDGPAFPRGSCDRPPSPIARRAYAARSGPRPWPRRRRRSPPRSGRWPASSRC